MKELVLKDRKTGKETRYDLTSSDFFEETAEIEQKKEEFLRQVIAEDSPSDFDNSEESERKLLISAKIFDKDTGERIMQCAVLVRKNKITGEEQRAKPIFGKRIFKAEAMENKLKNMAEDEAEMFIFNKWAEEGKIIINDPEMRMVDWNFQDESEETAERYRMEIAEEAKRRNETYEWSWEYLELTEDELWKLRHADEKKATRQEKRHKYIVLRHKETNEIEKIQNSRPGMASVETVIEGAKNSAALRRIKKKWEEEKLFPVEVLNKEIPIIEMPAEYKSAFDAEYLEDIKNWEFVSFKD